MTATTAVAVIAAKKSANGSHKTSHTKLPDEAVVRAISTKGVPYLLTVGDLRGAQYLRFPGCGTAINLAATCLPHENSLKGVHRDLSYRVSDRIPIGQIPKDAIVVTARFRIG